MHSNHQSFNRKHYKGDVNENEVIGCKIPNLASIERWVFLLHWKQHVSFGLNWWKFSYDTGTKSSLFWYILTPTFAETVRGRKLHQIIKCLVRVWAKTEHFLWADRSQFENHWHRPYWLTRSQDHRKVGLEVTSGHPVLPPAPYPPSFV